MPQYAKFTHIITAMGALKTSLIAGLFFISIMPLSVWSAEAKTISWEDLIPENAPQLAAPPSITHDSPVTVPPAQSEQIDVRPELNGKAIKLPGFIVPLEGDENRVTEFLLVPYFGACIHVPPPPANQIVHVKYPKGVPGELLYSPVWIEGPLSTSTVATELATSGYSMAAVEVTEYTE
ncbi:membrane protein [Oleiphilus messinensis]|uniref:Membrane protein n=1 Tax=Oleiphilus messinensis TaxID=141451 RepID=A0A1Y0IG21_9GAMM|nr:DUF3299 domain-containing protein [Oleiphilus messinensis]ARU59458.1 membrane protein [Oleiphilus messinensis]